MPQSTPTNQWTFEDYLARARYEGPVDVHKDFDRLQGQTLRIYNLMKDGIWRTLQDIEAITNYPSPSISSQLRHLRKSRFGGHIVDKRRRGNGGTWEYKLIIREILK